MTELIAKGAETSKCPVCETIHVKFGVIPGRDGQSVECPRCGRFAASRSIFDDIGNVARKDRLRLSALLRERSTFSLPPVALVGNTTPENQKALEKIGYYGASWRDLVEHEFPRSSSETLDRALRNLSRRAELGRWISPTAYDAALLYAEDDGVQEFMIKSLVEADLIERQKSGPIRLTANGWKRIANIERDAQALRLKRERASLLEIIFEKFSTEADLYAADQFPIDHQNKIAAFDSLYADGTLAQTPDGKLEFRLPSYFTSRFWDRDEALLNQLLPVMKEIYSEKKSSLTEVTDFITRIEKKGITITPVDVQRVLQLLRRLGLLGGFNNINEAGVQKIKNFGISEMILRPKTIADQMIHYNVYGATIPPAMSPLAGSAVLPLTKDNKKVFIVHGHEDKVRDDVASLIKTLGLEPIILHEKANQGMTLVEKFIKHSDVGFAVIVMTADDLGKAKTEENVRPRARQNVVFEWGYFVGSLGRDHVCALYEKGIDPPSDLHGIVYIALDAGGHWRFDILKELKAAGYSVDANKLLE